MRKLAVAVVLIACSKHADDWKVRKGPGFSVEAPREGKLVHGEAVGFPGVEAYDFGPTPSTNVTMQVDTIELKGVAPGDAIRRARDEVATGAAISTEDSVAMGDIPGKDLRLTANVPKAGPLDIRVRFVVHGTDLYKVVFAQREGHDEWAAGNRFVDSFKLD
jgi:hypothetical protein